MVSYFYLNNLFGSRIKRKKSGYFFKSNLDSPDYLSRLAFHRRLVLVSKKRFQETLKSVPFSRTFSGVFVPHSCTSKHIELTTAIVGVSWINIGERNRP